MNSKLIDFDELELKYKILIDKAKSLMNSINDPEHNIHHMNDVVNYTKEILTNLNEDVSIDACLISAYWHDVGRTKVDEGHEELSANMLKKEMIKLNYDNSLIEKCYNAILYHKWNMHPVTIEGLVIKDADKLGFIGKERWIECNKNGKRLDSIIELLPKIRDEILYFDVSKEIYDRDIVNFKKYL